MDLQLGNIGKICYINEQQCFFKDRFEYFYTVCNIMNYQTIIGTFVTGAVIIYVFTFNFYVLSHKANYLNICQVLLTRLNQLLPDGFLWVCCLKAIEV